MIDKNKIKHKFDWKFKLKFKLYLNDIIFLAFSIILVLTIRFSEIWDSNLTEYEIRNVFLGIFVLISWLFFLWLNGSRDLNILGFGADEYKRIINASLLSFTSVAFISYIFKLEISRAFVLLVFPMGLLALFVTRRIHRRKLIRERVKGKNISNVLLIYSGEEDPVEKRLKNNQHSGFKVIHRINSEKEVSLDAFSIVNQAKIHDCDFILIGQSSTMSAVEIRKLGWELEKTKISLAVAPAVIEIAGPRVKISIVEGLPLLHLDQPTFQGFSKFTKRLLDIFLSLFGLILLSPLFFTAAIVIKIFDKGSIFYRQIRIGRNDVEFTVFKFRTMYEGSHDYREQIMTNYGKDLRLAKLELDPRVTRPGKFLRRWSIDELPQLINVLKGEMSMVGPRPPLREEVNKYEISEKRRLLVKPGLTGLWQVSGRSELDWEDSVRLDLYYVENWSLTLDLLIIIRTFAAVWRGEGAY